MTADNRRSLAAGRGGSRWSHRSLPRAAARAAAAAAAPASGADRQFNDGAHQASSTPPTRRAARSSSRRPRRRRTPWTRATRTTRYVLELLAPVRPPADHLQAGRRARPAWSWSRTWHRPRRGQRGRQDLDVQASGRASSTRTARRSPPRTSSTASSAATSRRTSLSNGPTYFNAVPRPTATSTRARTRTSPDNWA